MGKETFFATTTAYEFHVKCLRHQRDSTTPAFTVRVLASMRR